MDENMQPGAAPSKSNTGLIIGLVAILILIGLFFFMGKKDKGGTTDTNNPAGTQEEGTTAVNDTPDSNIDVTGSVDVGVGTTKEFTVTGSNFSFAPNSLTVNKGDKVKITFKNADGLHDFVIDEFAVNSGRISGGQEKVVEFTADKAGSFEFYCSVGTHRQMGMKGTLVVK